MRAVALVALLILSAAPVQGMTPTPGFSFEPAELPTFERLTLDQWRAIADGDDPMGDAVDTDFFPLGDANGDGKADVWEATWGDSPRHSAITPGGKELWSYEPDDSEWFLALGDANRDDVTDFAVLDRESSDYVFTVLSGRDLSELTQLRASTESIEILPGFTITFIAFPTIHPDGGYLIWQSQVSDDGRYVANLGSNVASYGHSGPRRDLGVKHVDLEGQTLWTTQMAEPYTTHFIAGFSNEGREAIIASHHDPDSDHLQVLGLRPINPEPEETLSLQRMDLTDGSLTRIGTVPSIGDLAAVVVTTGNPAGPASHFVTQLRHDWDTFEFESRMDLLVDGASTATRIANDWVLASNAGDLDGDGNSETFLQWVFAAETELIRGAFDTIWTRERVFPLGLDLDGDGLDDVAEVEEEDDVVQVTFQHAWNHEPLWTLSMGSEETLDAEFVQDMDGQGDGDLLITTFPGATSPEELQDKDGYVQLVRGSDGAMFWERHIYAAGSGEFPRLNAFHYTSNDLDGDGADDFLINLEYIPRVTGFYCDNSGCTEEKEEGEIYNLATALDGVHAKRLLRGTAAAEPFDAMGLDGTTRGEANDDLEANYAPGPALALLVVAMLALTRRRP